MQLFSCSGRDEPFTVTVKGKPVLAGIRQNNGGR
jgi:hypothetical protein